MISVEDALEHVRSNRPKLGAEQIAVEKAVGRILTADIVATLDMPPFMSANIDGYAVSTCQARDKLKIIGESAAGHPFSGSLNPGEAVRISTGAKVPKGADRILIQEHATRDQDFVLASTTPHSGSHIRTKGSDFKTGENLLKAGQRLTSADIALCAAFNLSELIVLKKPNIALLSCGDELTSLGTEQSEGQIYDANAIGLKALLESWGADVSIFDRIKDNTDHISARISELSGFDIIVPIGGASVGNHDLMRPSFNAAGYENLFYKVAIRPGKPCWMSRKGNQLVVGLPGNPASAFVCAHIFLRALLNIEIPPLKAILTKDIEENDPRATFLRATIEIGDGKIFVTPIAHQDSYRLLPQTKAAALIKLPPLGGPFRNGENIDILLLGDLGLRR